MLLSLPQANPVTTALGVSAFLFVFVMKRRKPLIPAGLIAIAVGIVIVSVLNLDELGVAIVGVIPTGAPTLSLPSPGIFTIPYLVAGAFGIVFLAVGESLSTGRAFAARLGYQIDPDQELLALGAANINSGMFGGFTVDMSLSNTAAGVEAGAKVAVVFARHVGAGPADGRSSWRPSSPICHRPFSVRSSSRLSWACWMSTS